MLYMHFHIARSCCASYETKKFFPLAMNVIERSVHLRKYIPFEMNASAFR